MRQVYIEELKTTFPEFFNIRDVSETWSDGFHIIDQNNKDPDPFEGTLFPEEKNPVADIPDSIEHIIDELFGLNDQSSFDQNPFWDPGLLGEMADELKEIFGHDFPGAPGGADSFLDSKTDLVIRMVPVVDVFGFYLPWHRFDENSWGIYIFAEGIVALGKILHRMGKGLLPLNECNFLARAFIYHHEAYHNKVESFSSRLEVINRQPVFNKAVSKLYLGNGFSTKNSLIMRPGCIYHEESLANAYAFKKCQAIFSKYPKFQRKNLQTLARIVLYHFICKSPAKYKDAKDIIFRPPHYFFDTKSDANRRFEEVESIFNEEILNKTMFPSISNPRLWITQTKLMDPTLRRNSSYSYVINKKSKLASRLRLAVHYLSRKKLIKILKRETGGSINEKTGGKHPGKFILGSQKVPIPGNRNREIKIGTAESILKELGISKNIKELL